MAEQDINADKCRDALRGTSSGFRQQYENVSVTLVDDKELNVTWKFSTDRDFDEYEEYLRLYTWWTNDDKKRYVTDPVINGMTHSGVWRQAFVRRTKVKDSEYNLTLTLRSGFAETLVWEEARRVSADKTLGNTSKVQNDAGSDISNTQSDSPELWTTVRFPNINPFKIHAILTSITGATYADKVINGGETLSGTWHQIKATAGVMDDQSAYIELTIARPQYTLNAYSANSTLNQQAVHYLWNVPKDLAQGIINGWEEIGNSATASYNQQEGTVDLILSGLDNIQANLSKEDIPTACDTTETYHFAWGYTETQIGTFLDAHKSALGAGVTREISVRTRGDGLFDAIIIETTVTYNAGKHLVSITCPSGTKITRQKDWGWKLPLATLEAKEAEYDTTINAVGVSTDFQVTRRDNCTFDYQATIVTTTPLEDSVSIAKGASEGTGVVVAGGKNVTTTELSTLATTFASAARKSVDIRLVPNEDDTWDYSVVERDVQSAEATGTIEIGADLGLGLAVASGKNVSSATLTAAIANYTSGARKRQEISINANDDGTFDYVIRQSTVQSANDTWDVGTRGLTEELKVGANEDDFAETTISSSSAKGKTVLLEARFNDDGTVSYVQRNRQRSEQEVAVSAGTYVQDNDTQVHTGDVTQLAEDLLVKEGAADELVAEGVSALFDIQVREDGSAEWRRTVLTAKARESETLGAETLVLSRLLPKLDRYGYEDYAVVFRNVASANLPSYGMGENDYGYIQSLRMNDDGTFDGTRIERTYLGGGDGTFYIISRPDDVTNDNPSNVAPDFYTLVDIRIDYANRRHHEVTYTFEEIWCTDYGEAINFINGKYTVGSGGSDIQYASIGGSNYWHAIKLTGIEFGTGWTDWAAAAPTTKIGNAGTSGG